MEQGSVVVFHIFGIPVTGYITTMWGVMAVLLAIALIVRGSLKKVPDRFQMLAEYSLEGMLNFFGGILGPERAPPVLSVPDDLLPVHPVLQLVGDHPRRRAL